MRVFITGATGFAGSHLVDQLIAEGHEVVALVHGPTSHQGLPDARSGKFLGICSRWLR